VTACSRRGRRTVAAFASLAVGLQICYPLVHGAARMHLAVAIVVVFASACVLHAAVTRGAARAVAVLLVTAGLGFCVELVGVATHLPFGAYRYGADLGPRVSGVPLVVGLAWTMLAWPAVIATRRIARGTLARILVGAWAVAAADLFLDPQLVAGGAWHWIDPSPHLPGVDTVPLTNDLGWLAAGLLVSAAIQAVSPDDGIDDRHDGVMVVLYLWLWVGWTIALFAFLDLPAAAAWGAVGMGLVAAPLAIDTARRVRLEWSRARLDRAATPRVGRQPSSTRRSTPPRTPRAATPQS
jgi:uncharacterized membrane protein